MTNTYLFKILKKKIKLGLTNDAERILRKHVKAANFILMPIHSESNKHWTLAILYNVNMNKQRDDSRNSSSSADFDWN